MTDTTPTGSLRPAAVLLAVLLLGSTGAQAGSFGPRVGVGTSLGVGGGMVGPGPGLPSRGPAGYPVAAPRAYVYPGVGVPGPAGPLDPRGVYDPRGPYDPR